MKASPGTMQSLESAAPGDGKAPTPTTANFSTDSVVDLPSPLGPASRKQGLPSRTTKETATNVQATQNSAGAGQPLPSPSNQQKGDIETVDGRQANASSSEQVSKSDDQVDTSSNQEQAINPDPNPEDADSGVDFSHLLGNDLFNNMNGGEEGEGYDINFAGFNMDADIFEIYMNDNDGYEGGSQTNDGS
ncbi:hypothetical protein QFC22_002848 [Naganishia vaughanmartiniae]|uniref:Uncharacterized protein n=1 Tax=Naganishia vaughanmartiniae TaxID=1424756 RepID=A0ACC2XAT8_9TREE|nr:hypothetical protein QFC22_002848 [Naganishia vaughanmartiniae]